MEKTAKNLVVGDRVIDASGKPLTVKAVGRGLGRGTILIVWKEHVKPQWYCVQRSDIMTLAE